MAIRTMAILLAAVELTPTLAPSQMDWLNPTMSDPLAIAGKPNKANGTKVISKATGFSGETLRSESPWLPMEPATPLLSASGVTETTLLSGRVSTPGSEADLLTIKRSWVRFIIRSMMSRSIQTSVATVEDRRTSAASILAVPIFFSPTVQFTSLLIRSMWFQEKMAFFTNWHSVMMEEF